MTNPFNTDTIKFAYTTAFEQYQTYGSETRQNIYTGETTVTQTANLINSQGNQYTILAKKLKSITCPNQEVVNFFYAPVTRCDCLGDSILKEITQKDGLTGASRSIQLYQSYIDQFNRHTAITAVDPAAVPALILLHPCG